MITWDPIAPGEVLISGINWAPRLGNDTINSSVWSVSTPAGLILTNKTYLNNVSYVTVAGAVLGILYSLTNTITTVGNQTEVETVQFVCAVK